MLDVMFNLDSEWPVWMDFRALSSACLELANYLAMTISIIVITSSSSSSILLEYFLTAWKCDRKVQQNVSLRRKKKKRLLVDVNRKTSVLEVQAWAFPGFFGKKRKVTYFIRNYRAFFIFPKSQKSLQFYVLAKRSQRKVEGLISLSRQILLPPPPPAATKQNKTKHPK